MTPFDTYRDHYPYAGLERDDAGVLSLTLHTNGGPFVFEQAVQDTLTRLFRDIADDPANRAVIVTGTGETFCTEVDGAELAAIVSDFAPSSADRWRTNGRSTLLALLDIDAPVIWAWNGPVTVHPEFWFGGADLILADPSAYVRDETHLAGGMMTGGDALPVWESLLGLPRARRFHLTGQTLDAAELETLGIVHEIVPQERQAARARALLEPLLALAPLTLRYARSAINGRLRRFAFEETAASYGLLGLAAIERFSFPPPERPVP